MDEKALGLIETIGLIPAVEAADTAVKSASVELEGFRMIGAGLVTILIRGDVSSVQASVDAGRCAAERVGEVISAHVIARTGEGLESVLPDPEKGSTSNDLSDVKNSTDALEKSSDASDEVTDTILEVEESQIDFKDITVEDVDLADQMEREISSKIKIPGKSALKKMNVTKLRELARKTEGISISRKDIKSARKKELIEAIFKAHQKQEKL
ncbi:MAG: BMC domain-containing protein [Desulfobacterales bacterium]|nr:BMC domain-containing protein [Desulfobacterales bacterium]